MMFDAGEYCQCSCDVGEHLPMTSDTDTFPIESRRHYGGAWFCFPTTQMTTSESSGES